MKVTPEQRFTFDEVAELYDRHRPGYPEALFEDLVALSGIAPAGRILEIGAGTGQATLPLARRGLRVLCLEPGAALARVARGKLAGFPRVEVLETTFEAWPLEARGFGLVVSAQAFHWVAPELRFAKAAAALGAGGALAVVGNAAVFGASPNRRALDAVYARHAPALHDADPAVSFYAEGGPITALFAESGCFGPVTWRRYPWAQRYSAADYCGFLRTHSNHRLLPPEQREALLAAVAEAIEEHGGSIEVPYDAHLYLAPLAAPAEPAAGGR